MEEHEVEIKSAKHCDNLAENGAIAPYVDLDGFLL